MLKLEKIDELEKFEGGIIYHRDVYTLGEYSVIKDMTVFIGDKVMINVSVEPPFDSYLPAIYYRDKFFGNSEPRFEIQTSSYGSLKADEFSRFLEAQQVGLEAAQILTAELL